jgi:DNA-binding MarR family transcriptional regulator
VDGAPGFDADVAARLRRVVLKLTRALNESAATEDLTPTQASVLGVVDGRGPVRLAELVAAEGVNPTMLSRVVGALEAAGLIERRPDAADQRSVVVSVTPLGRETATRVRDRRTAALTAVVHRLPARTRTALLAGLPALEALTEAFDAAAGDAPDARRR